MTLFSTITLIKLAYALVIFIFGFILSKKIKTLAERALSYRYSRHHTLVFSRILFYLIFITFLIIALQHIGFNLSVLLGAAGIFTVALGFASQTAVSNLISGFFLLFEQPFHIGDNIAVKGIQGIVHSIDLLSTKLKTADNQLIRIPNEVMIKSEIANLSCFSERRLDLCLQIAYDNDIDKVKTILLNIAQKITLALVVPAPQVFINQFKESSIEISLFVWAKTNELVKLKNELQEKIKQQFEAEGIEWSYDYLRSQPNH